MASVFISYRRSGGAEFARLIRDAIQNRGYSVFLDVEDLRSGPFNTALFGQIERAQDFIVVLSPGSLDPTHAKLEDWVSLEIEHAIKNKRNIVPVLLPNFEWPKDPLTEDIAALRNYQGLTPSHEYFDASMNRLASLLHSKPRRTANRVLAAAAAAVLMAGIAASLWVGLKGSDTRHQGIEPPRRESPANNVAELPAAGQAATSGAASQAAERRQKANVYVIRGDQQLSSLPLSIEQFEKAVQYYKAAIEMDGNYALAYQQLGLAYTSVIGRPTLPVEMHFEYLTLAAEAFGKATELEPGDPVFRKNYAEAYGSMGMLYLQRQNWTLAEQNLTKSLEILANKTFYCARGYVHNQTKQYELAILDLSKAIDMDRKYVDAYLYMANAYEALDRPEEARRYRRLAEALVDKPEPTAAVASGAATVRVVYAKARRNDPRIKTAIQLIEQAGFQTQAFVEIEASSITRLLVGPKITAETREALGDAIRKSWDPAPVITETKASQLPIGDDAMGKDIQAILYLGGP